jgi:4-diphosphocytidyl-2-C-methyl-D-erythritol kinase
VLVRAFAKINLSLRVLGVRADGFHELRTVFQSIALHDSLKIERTRGPFRLICDDPGLPVDKGNLVSQAVEAIWETSGRRGVPRDLAIELTKRIPLEAGLGGGSSDAAAVLRALASMWRVDRPRVRAIAARLGSDVPYFLEGGTVLGLERGDLLFPLADYPKAWVALVSPPFGVSSAEAYGWWDGDRDAGRLKKTRRTLFSLAPAKEGYGHFFNDLQDAVTARHPEIARIVSALRRAGASHAAMSGSGSAVFGLFGTRSAAMAAGTTLVRSTASAANCAILVTRTLTRAESMRLAAK